jgi:hypothetical protein
LVLDDGGSPVNMVSSTTATLWLQQGRARRCRTKSLGQYFVDLRDAGGQSLGYVYDIETELFPIGRDGSPSPYPCPIRVHVVTEFEGSGVLVGTQQHMKWRMETSHRSGLKTIEVAPGIDFVFPFSTRVDGGAGGADRVEAVPS